MVDELSGSPSQAQRTIGFQRMRVNRLFGEASWIGEPEKEWSLAAAAHAHS